MNVQEPAEGNDDERVVEGGVTTKTEIGPDGRNPELPTAKNAIRYLVVGLLSGGLFFVIGLLLGFQESRNTLALPTEAPAMTQCTSETLAQLDLKQPPTPAILRQLDEHCWSLVRSQQLLTDFSIRKLNFIQQYHANGILMWMVVIITISGVILAGIQVLVSYRLAESNTQALPTSSELILRRDRIVLRSSVTGLLILLLSFAFFLVFVLYVYRFEKWQDQDILKPHQTLTLPPGGLGEPPSEAPK